MKPDGPCLFVFNHCRQFIRTVPALPRDEGDKDDVDSRAKVGRFNASCKHSTALTVLLRRIEPEPIDFIPSTPICSWMLMDEHRQYLLLETAESRCRSSPESAGIPRFAQLTVAGREATVAARGDGGGGEAAGFGYSLAPRSRLAVTAAAAGGSHD